MRTVLHRAVLDVHGVEKSSRERVFNGWCMSCNHSNASRGVNSAQIIATRLAAAYPTRVVKLSERPFKAQIRPIDGTISPILLKLWLHQQFGEPGVEALTARAEPVCRDGMIAVTNTIPKARMSQRLARDITSFPSNIGADTLILAGEEDKVSPKAVVVSEGTHSKGESDYNEMCGLRGSCGRYWRRCEGIKEFLE